MNTRHRFLGLTIGILLCTGAVSLAQEEPDLQAIATKIQANQESLRKYSWKSRVALSIDGEQKKLDMFQLRYDVDGLLQKTISTAFARTEGNVFKLQAQDVVVQGDSILIEVLPATKQPVSIQVKSTLEGSPVVLNVMFQKLADGTNYVAKSTIDTQFDKKQLQVVTENFDHIKQGG